jgi:hypothetical protein
MLYGLAHGAVFWKLHRRREQSVYDLRTYPVNPPLHSLEGLRIVHSVIVHMLERAEELLRSKVMIWTSLPVIAKPERNISTMGAIGLHTCSIKALP